MLTINPLALRAIVGKTRNQIVKAWESAPKACTNTGFHDQSVRKFMARIPVTNEWTTVPVPLFDLVCILSGIDANLCHARGRQVRKWEDANGVSHEEVVHEDLGGDIVAELQRQIPESFPVSVSVGGNAPKRATASVLKSGFDLKTLFA